MRIFEFNAASETGKINAIHQHGTLIQKVIENDKIICYYRIHDFFVEMQYDRLYRILQTIDAFNLPASSLDQFASNTFAKPA